LYPMKQLCFDNYSTEQWAELKKMFQNAFW